MLKKLKTAISIFLGFWKTCGIGVALKWTLILISNLPRYDKEKNLRFVDDLLGEGPFLCRSKHGRAWLGGKHVISAIRSIWIREEYLAGNFLTVPPKAMVVDLGAGLGDFTLLVLTYSPDIKVIAVEQSDESCKILRRNLELNGWLERVKIYKGLIGGITSKQEEIIHHGGETDKFLTEEDLIEHSGLKHIDFLKCDIEGSEFQLLTEYSPLLSIADQVSIELHDWGGDFQEFKQMLLRSGFELKTHRPHLTDNTVVYARRPKN